MLNKKSSSKWSMAYVSLFLVFVLNCGPHWLFAQEDEPGITASTDLEFQVSSRPEVRLLLSQSFTFPFLAGDGPLTKDNNIKTVVTADVTPVSVAGIGEIIWQPVAFFLVSGGGQAGSGWNIPLGNGIGFYVPVPGDSPRKTELQGEAFDGLQWSAWGAGTFQFDLGAVIPGDWNHILFQTRQEFRYAAYTAAGPNDSWIYLNDGGENKNGWNYYASYVLGYHMPLSPLLDTIAFMAELNKPLYHTPGEESWGGNLGQWYFSCLFNFSFTPRLSTALAIQLWTRRNHDTTDFENTEYFYQDIPLAPEGSKRILLFYRAALILNYKIR